MKEYLETTDKRKQIEFSHKIKIQKLPELNEEIVSRIEESTLKLINEKGWTTEKEILSNVILYFKGQRI